MALIDRVKYNALSDQELIWRHPKDNLVLGTQVIVNESQEVVFYKGGKALDVLGPGTHTLSTANIPLLGALINLPFGGKTPFAAEVYYVNKNAKLDLLWGSREPFLILDPQFQIVVPLRANGQFGLRVSDSRLLVTSLVGTLSSFDTRTAGDYFKGVLILKLKDRLAKYVVAEKIPVLELTAHLDELSRSIREPIAEEFSRFGLEVVNLFVTSADVPEDDPSVVKMREVMGTRLELMQLGDGYRLKRTFDVLEASANNPGGAMGSLMAGGLGLGIGLGAGPSLGASLGGNLNVGGAAVPVAGLACKQCSAAIPAGSRFCPGCGQAVAPASAPCSACGAAMPVGAAFCPSCGVKGK